MGNEVSHKQRVNSDGKKVYLALRSRDIILHYSYKMKLSITDISLFPHGLEGLKLWDADIVLSRYIILENERFGNKSAFVLKGGVGIAGITLSKWAGCKKVDMCDMNKQVVGNMINNCQRNGIKNVNCFELNLCDYTKYTQKYDFAFATDLLNLGIKPHIILNVWRKVLTIGGEGIMVMPENKEKAVKFLQAVDRSEFKISNMILTAEEYEVSPLLNKLQGQAEFPLLGKTQFYVISLTKLKEMPLESQKEDNPKTAEKMEQPVNVYKTPEKQSKIQPINLPKQQKDVSRENKSQKVLQSQKEIGVPVTMTKTKIQQERNESPIKKLQKKAENEVIQQSQKPQIGQKKENPKQGSQGL